MAVATLAARRNAWHGRGVTRLRVLLCPALLALLMPAPCAPAQSADRVATNAWAVHELRADRWWLLNLPEGRRFDASALLLAPGGELWTVNDQAPGIYRIQFHDGTNVADLVRMPDLLGDEDVARLLARPRSRSRLDIEGLAMDAQGRLFLSEEARRWILMRDPDSRTWEPLPIDWSPVRRWFHRTDLNASFEGVAAGGDRLYVANERQEGRILVIEPGSWKVVDDFAVAPADSIGDDHHYSDLCWAEGSLWVLMRDVQRLLRVDPARKTVLAEFDYARMEFAREVAYGALFAPGFMEGVAVSPTHIWLISDNNGFGRRVRTSDRRPTLFRCPRPDLPAKGGTAP